MLAMEEGRREGDKKKTITSRRPTAQPSIGFISAAWDGKEGERSRQQSDLPISLDCGGRAGLLSKVSVGNEVDSKPPSREISLIATKFPSLLENACIANCGDGSVDRRYSLKWPLLSRSPTPRTCIGLGVADPPCLFCLST